MSRNEAAGLDRDYEKRASSITIALQRNYEIAHVEHGHAYLRIGPFAMRLGAQPASRRKCKAVFGKETFIAERDKAYGRALEEELIKMHVGSLK